MQLVANFVTIVPIHNGIIPDNNILPAPFPYQIQLKLPVLFSAKGANQIFKLRVDSQLPKFLF